MKHFICGSLFLFLLPWLIYGVTQDCICKTPSGSNVPYIIQDSDTLSQQFTSIRDAFMKTVATAPKFNRLEATILIKQKSLKNGQEFWIRGMTTNATGTNYPASCVKLNYMTSSLFYCKQNGLPYNCVEKHVFPMIQYSDNFETGVVVDTISGQPNIVNLTSADDPRFASFLSKRQFTSTVLQRFGYLGNQQILSKTYPTNSGAGPIGAEKVLLNLYGRNAMQSCCSTLLMMDLIKGGPLMQSVATDYSSLESLTEYVESALFHRRHDNYSPTGDAYPAGTILRTKIGLAYDTLEEIAHITLPNGQEIVFSAYSNAFQRPTDDGMLTRFADTFLSGLNLLTGIPPMFIVDTSDSASYQYQGNWIKVDKSSSNAPDAIGNFYFVSQDTNAQFSWNVNVPEDGLYELLVYTPSVTNSNTNTVYTVNHQYGQDEVVVNMQDYSRWKPLGDFFLLKGFQTIVRISVNSPTMITVANALKLSKYPVCNGVAGSFC